MNWFANPKSTVAALFFLGAVIGWVVAALGFARVVTGEPSSGDAREVSYAGRARKGLETLLRLAEDPAYRRERLLITVGSLLFIGLAAAGSAVVLLFPSSWY